MIALDILIGLGVLVIAGVFFWMGRRFERFVLKS